MLGAASIPAAARNLYPATWDSSHKARLLVKSGSPVRASGPANAGTTHSSRQQHSNALNLLLHTVPAKTAETNLPSSCDEGWIAASKRRLSPHRLKRLSWE